MALCNATPRADTNQYQRERLDRFNRQQGYQWLEAAGYTRHSHPENRAKVCNLDSCPYDRNSNWIGLVGYALGIWELTNSPPEYRKSIGDRGRVYYRDDAKELAKAYLHAKHAYGVEFVTTEYGVKAVTTPVEEPQETDTSQRDRVLGKVQGKGLAPEYQVPEGYVLVPEKPPKKPRGLPFKKGRDSRRYTGG